jgi:hypothetical protein
MAAYYYRRARKRSRKHRSIRLQNRSDRAAAADINGHLAAQPPPNPGRLGQEAKHRGPVEQSALGKWSSQREARYSAPFLHLSSVVAARAGVARATKVRRSAQTRVCVGCHLGYGGVPGVLSYPGRSRGKKRAQAYPTPRREARMTGRLMLRASGLIGPRGPSPISTTNLDAFL